MERQFCINWPALVEEAKQRRKAQRLTQARLAKMAGVSTPTISHFESGDTSTQVSTAISIFTVLGMNDQRNLIFTQQDEYYEPSHQVVIFTGRDGNKTVKCAVSKEALTDYFNGDGRDPLKVFQANRESIVHKARRKYLAGNTESNGTVLLKDDDFG